MEPGFVWFDLIDRLKRFIFVKLFPFTMTGTTLTQPVALPHNNVTTLVADPNRVEDLLSEDPLFSDNQSSAVFWNTCLGDWCGLFLLGANNTTTATDGTTTMKGLKLLGKGKSSTTSNNNKNANDDDATVATTPSESDDDASHDSEQQQQQQQINNNNTIAGHVHIIYPHGQEDGYEAEHDSDLESIESVSNNNRITRTFAAAFVEVAPFDEPTEVNDHQDDDDKKQKTQEPVWHHCEGMVSWEETVVVSLTKTTTEKNKNPHCLDADYEQDEGSTSSTVRGVVIQAGLLLLDQQILETQNQEEEQARVAAAAPKVSTTQKGLPEDDTTTSSVYMNKSYDDGILAEDPPQQDPPGNYVTDQSDGVGHTPCCSLLRELALIDKEDEEAAPPPPASIHVTTPQRRWTSFGMPRLQRQLLLARGWDPHRRSTRAEGATAEQTHLTAAEAIVPLRTQRSLMNTDEDSCCSEDGPAASVVSFSSISDQSSTSLEHDDDEEEPEALVTPQVVAVVQEDARPEEPETRDDP